ncbi:RIKEN cDNA 2810452K22, isoform CRA_a, partial [Mus musculus]
RNLPVGRRMEAKTLGIATPRKPVLSVSARKLKDNAADWHNLILKWDSLSEKGFTTASSIANLKVSLLSKEKVELESSSPASMEEEEKTNLDYDKGLEALCEELQAILDGLMSKKAQAHRGAIRVRSAGAVVPVPLSNSSPLGFRRLFGAKALLLHRKLTETKIQMKMEKLSSTTKGICELENYHYREESSRPPLFHTWPTAFFYEVSRRLSEAYKKELLLKHTIGAELAHTADRNLSLTYLSMWLHQPYIESNSKLQLESMLLETGHRAL